MHLYLVRHGQSYVNLSPLPQSNADEPLTETGQQQTAALAQWLPGILPHVEVIYSSTLRRAMETAKPLAQLYGLTIHPDERLREIGCNRQDHTPLSNHSLPPYADFWSSERPFSSITPAIEQGESLMHFRTRVGAFLEGLWPQHKDQSLLVVTHSRVIEMIFDHAFNVGPWRRCEVETQHTALTHFEVLPQPRPEMWRLHRHNCTDHLAALPGERPGTRPTAQG